jgi:FtsZ-interacting cell division protein ZipA
MSLALPCAEGWACDRSGFALTEGGYFCDMSNTTLIIVIVVAIVVIAAIAVVGYRLAKQRRTTGLREQYGPEYDRALEQADSQREAESELQDRSKRHEKLELRSLDSSERGDFERRWSDVQRQFVDDPSNAVRNADRLVVEVMAARGYPVEDFDQRAGKPRRQRRHRGSSPGRDVLPIAGLGLTRGRRRSQSAQRQRERARQQSDH